MASVSGAAAAVSYGDDPRAFREHVKKQSNVEREQTKEGVDTGWTVVNPVNGEEVPIFRIHSLNLFGCLLLPPQPSDGIQREEREGV